MYKLVVVSGPIRGASFVVKEGELSIGRQAGNTIVIQSSKVSKQHCKIVMKGTDAEVIDLGSSNGTFVNGVLTKAKKIKPGDRISAGEYVFELVETTQSAVRTAPAVAGLGNVIQFHSSAGPSQNTNTLGQSSILDSSHQSSQNHPPKDLIGKITWNFEHHFMPIFYSLNLKHEWKFLCITLFVTFMLGNLVISVYPQLDANRATIVRETGRRARFMARQIAEQNAPFLAQRAETKAEIGMIENAEGVRVAVLIDLENRIIAPAAKMNQYLVSGGEALVGVKARDLFRGGRETGFWEEIDPSTVVAVEPVKVMNPTVGRNIVVAMSVVSIDTSLSVPDMGEMGMVYAETLIMTGILGGFILLILYKITLRPFQVLNEDMDKALKGDVTQVSHEYKIQELNPLWDIINSAILRIPKSDLSLQGGLGGSSIDVGNIDEYAGPLKMLGNLSNFGFVVFDASQKIIYINSMFEEISGIRADGAIGHDMTDVARDQSMGIFTNDILSRTSAGGDGVIEDYDFSGISYKMYAAAFGAPGTSSKCFVLAAVRAET